MAVSFRTHASGSATSNLTTARDERGRFLALRREAGSWRWRRLSSCAFLLPVHDLRQQMVALQSQLQQVQLERTTLTSKLKASQAEISSLQSVRQWYQQQLALAQEARVRLQGEMAHIQVCPDGRAGCTPRLVQNDCFFPKLRLRF